MFSLEKTKGTGKDAIEWVLTTDLEEFKECTLCGKKLNSGYLCKELESIYCEVCEKTKWANHLCESKIIENKIFTPRGWELIKGDGHTHVFVRLNYRGG